MGDSSGSKMLPENAWADVPMGHIWKSQLFLLGQKHQLILRDVLFVLQCEFLAPDGLEGKKKRFPAHKTFVLIKQRGICFSSLRVCFLGFCQAFCTQISTNLLAMGGRCHTKLGRFFLPEVGGMKTKDEGCIPNTRLPSPAVPDPLHHLSRKEAPQFIRG